MSDYERVSDLVDNASFPKDEEEEIIEKECLGCEIEYDVDTLFMGYCKVCKMQIVKDFQNYLSLMDENKKKLLEEYYDGERVF